MASTYYSLTYHIVFGTKYRKPTINPAWQSQLHAYLAGTAKGLGAECLGVGGVEDHVHVLVGLTPSHCPKDFLRELKKASSAWVHREMHAAAFEWQEGYGLFTESHARRSQLRRYVANQAEHH
jgi:REP element-mobilizing transposase RayT